MSEQNCQVQALRSPTPQQLTITIKTLIGRQFSLTITPTTTVHQVKQLIQQTLGMPPDQQRIIYSNKVIHDQQTMGECNVKADDFMHMVMRLNGDVGEFEGLGLAGTTHIEMEDSKEITNHNVEDMIRSLDGDQMGKFQTIQLDQYQQDILKLRQYADQKYHDAIQIGAQDFDTQDFKLPLNQQTLLSLISPTLLVNLQSILKNPDPTNSPTIILRRCSAHNKLLKFHLDDKSRKTLQFCLSSDAEYKGGRLMYATEGKIHVPERKRGTVTVHDDRIVHGVSLLQEGVRYGLFLLVK